MTDFIHRVIHIKHTIEWHWSKIFRPANRLHIPTLDRAPQDLDAVYLHACFAILVRFVEEEMTVFANMTGEPIGKFSREQAIKNVITYLESSEPDDKEIARLYLWWKSYNNPVKAIDLFENHGNQNEPIFTDIGYGSKVDLNFTPEQELVSLVRNTRDMIGYNEEEANLLKLTSLRKKLWF